MFICLLLLNNSLQDIATTDTYDTAIVGGGLAGLSLSILLAKKGYKVILFEKEQYPFHRVCGEYISLESWNFITSLGIDLEKMNLPIIDRLHISSPNGNLLQHTLPLGGFGISRYTLDHSLAEVARSHGVIIKEKTKITDIIFNNTFFSLKTNQQTYSAIITCCSFGKRSNLDIKWKRPFTIATKNRLNNYIAVKYHINTDTPDNIIALHNFKDGYCGISKIDNDAYSLCYLTTADNLKKSGNIRVMEQTILSQNPHLKKIFRESKSIYKAPLSISQISFDAKKQVMNHMLMIGDAAGMITPLCGNGMSMALHGSKIAAEQIHLFFEGDSTREIMEKQYAKNWNCLFSKRLRAGRFIQRLFGNKWLTNRFIAINKKIPTLADKLIRQTHGQPF
ncbi:MAG: NAD(P)/FAD-dependent oxidoreductase [Sphingobacteriales bacterium]|nr:NAD(P)/FAD-dependent oxidoreductase [Sphingobacteriales bacterium]